MKSKKLNKKLVLKKETIANLRDKELSFIKGGERTDLCPGTREACSNPRYCGTLNVRLCESQPNWCYNTYYDTCLCGG